MKILYLNLIFLLFIPAALQCGFHPDLIKNTMTQVNSRKFAVNRQYGDNFQTYSTQFPSKHDGSKIMVHKNTPPKKLLQMKSNPPVYYLISYDARIKYTCNLYGLFEPKDVQNLFETLEYFHNAQYKQ